MARNGYISEVEIKRARGRNVYFLDVNLQGEKLRLPLGSCSKNTAGVMAGLLEGNSLSCDAKPLQAQLRSVQGSVKLTLEVFTPKDALHTLSKNIGNRPTTPSRIQRYARNMSEDGWLVTGEALVFDSKGNLIDGQSRLWAVVNSGKAAIFAVVRGVQREAQRVIDGNLPRNVGDFISNEANFGDCPPGRKISSYISPIVTLASGVNNHNDPSMITQVAKLYQQDLEWIHEQMNPDHDERRCIKHSDLIAGLLIFHHFYPKEAEDFVIQFVEGYGGKLDPHLVLNHYFNATRGHGYYMDSALLRRLRTLQAAREFVLGRKFPRANRDEHGFPEVPRMGDGENGSSPVDPKYVEELIEFFSKNGRKALIPDNGWDKYIKKGCNKARKLVIEESDAPELCVTNS